MRSNSWPMAIRVSLLALSSFLVLDLGWAASDEASRKFEAVLDAAVKDPNDEAKVQAFIDQLVEAPAGSGKYIVEGDIGLIRPEIKPYLISRQPGRDKDGTGKLRNQSGELIVNLGPTGEFDYRKDPQDRKLTFAVDQQSFPTPAMAADVAKRARAAMDAWVNACPDCNISFDEHQAKPGFDFSGVTFAIRYSDTQSGALARSFFPSSAPEDSVLSIFPGFFDPSLKFDKTGLLRHEIGHILGYRHQHITGIPGCAKEGTNWVPITPDPNNNSVMRYFCGGGGSWDLSLRESDILGHRCLYLTGKPCAQ
ncbi:hypothetical protein FJ937_06945 [Mesorhizobium sp. B2-4-4]|uniref:hypothetical protein n=1 Tax=Mesorhizobium sp. B2-4-4 TaxID=2589945 RepID=UPI0011267192|nr:hypothetical protein [Mesorhizobium sp. B2-4-4]TPL53091.1 hypothetical protein FJ937_06945 [Mesorhizobium sp. B2-4-4]